MSFIGLLVPVLTVCWVSKEASGGHCGPLLDRRCRVLSQSPETTRTVLPLPGRSSALESESRVRHSVPTPATRPVLRPGVIVTGQTLCTYSRDQAGPQTWSQSHGSDTLYLLPRPGWSSDLESESRVRHSVPTPATRLVLRPGVRVTGQTSCTYSRDQAGPQTWSQSHGSDTLYLLPRPGWSSDLESESRVRHSVSTPATRLVLRPGVRVTGQTICTYSRDQAGPPHWRVRVTGQTLCTYSRDQAGPQTWSQSHGSDTLYLLPRPGWSSDLESESRVRLSVLPRPGRSSDLESESRVRHPVPTPATRLVLRPGVRVTGPTLCTYSRDQAGPQTWSQSHGSDTLYLLPRPGWSSDLESESRVRHSSFPERIHSRNGRAQPAECPTVSRAEHISQNQRAAGVQC